MLYYIQYYFTTEPLYPVSHQIGQDIDIKCWQQVSSFKLDELVSKYMFKQLDGTQPVFVFFKFENMGEREFILEIYRNSIVELDKFNIRINMSQLKENIVVVRI